MVHTGLSSWYMLHLEFELERPAPTPATMKLLHHSVLVYFFANYGLNLEIYHRVGLLRT